MFVNTWVRAMADDDGDNIAENNTPVEFCFLSLPAGYTSDPGSDNCPDIANTDQAKFDGD